MEWHTSLKNDNSFLDKIDIDLFGINLGILGVDNCGKSVLYKFILTHKLVHGIDSTSTRQKQEKIKIEFHGSKEIIRIRNFFDVGGQRELYQFKKKTFNQSYCIIYVVRSDLILDIGGTQDNDVIRKYRAALELDFANISQWQRDLNLWQRNSFSKLIIVGNYFGEIDNEETVSHYLSNQKNYHRYFRDRFTDITGGLYFPKTEIKWVTGTLVSQKFATELVHGILKSLISQET
ncbi:MAG: hypothetical protein F6K54_13040 [Okeania sp. SIO3B5]|uniref:ADP-ribosylation factor-like protein n=1 Tax=Okeania sp. SIO3B5 TaxID=2607811 RepID=UPI001400E6F8|nr:ADP-ribosylation factor-like protein [Okeania sp. SIO3B5]NEO53921.1 hypothetical protein [Okeania sp. SIO3B5]